MQIKEKIMKKKKTKQKTPNKTKNPQVPGCLCKITHQWGEIIYILPHLQHYTQQHKKHNLQALTIPGHRPTRHWASNVALAGVSVRYKNLWKKSASPETILPSTGWHKYFPCTVLLSACLSLRQYGFSLSLSFW